MIRAIILAVVAASAVLIIAIVAEAAASKAVDADVPVNEPVTPTEPVDTALPTGPALDPPATDPDDLTLVERYYRQRKDRRAIAEYRRLGAVAGRGRDRRRDFGP
jgi:hypothetical protein